MKNNIISLFLMLIIVGCGNNEKFEQSTVIDMNNLVEKRLSSNVIDSLFPNKKTIILKNSETENVSMISKIRYASNKVYVFCDHPSDSKVLVYDETGDFLFKVGMIGRAKEEYLRATDFDIDNKGNIYILDSKKKTILKYDDKGMYVSTFGVKYAPDSFCWIKDSVFAMAYTCWNSSEPKKQLSMLDFNDNTEKELLYYDDFFDVEMILSSASFSSANNKIIYHNPISDYAYEIGLNGEISQIYHFDFGNNSVKDRDKVGIESKLASGAYKKYITLMSFCSIDNNYVIGGLLDKMKQKNFVLDLKNRIIYKSEVEDYPAYGQMLCVADDYLVSYINYITYKNNEGSFTEVEKKMLENDNIILNFYKL